MGPCLRVALLTAIIMGSISLHAQETQELVQVDSSGLNIALEKRDGKYVALTQAQRSLLIESIKSSLQLNGFAKGQGKIVSRTDHIAQLHVGEDHAMVTVATKDSSGKLQTQCVQGAEAAVELVSGSEQVK